ncbi:MAG TPA: hypothetical protein VFR81_15450, partial [Longimicrobium sp.]|nr:hypothetical protein [Longimicrobium sp.]
MSDFFSRAARRAVGMGPRVEPVLAPRFAAPSPLASADPLAAPDPAVDRPEDVSHDLPRARRRSASDPADPASPRANEIDRRAEHPAPRIASPVHHEELRAEPVRPAIAPPSPSPAPRGRSAIPPIAPSPVAEAVDQAASSAP